MAGKGGGAWKVAYADFVTAMMAFFLVMWICSQDQKVKKAVADYFGDPYSSKHGMSKSPQRSGAIYEKLNTGAVPEAESVALGRGRDSHSPRRDLSAVTKIVSDWLHADPKVSQHWREQARKLRQAAQASGENESGQSADKVASKQLAQQMKDEMMRGIPGQAKGLYKELLLEVMADVNWGEIADDILAH